MSGLNTMINGITLVQMARCILVETATIDDVQYTFGDDGA
ncbi:hypothetical protein DFH81_000009 [Clostridium beijerinckii]|nr:hypothetical protein [Clostridium beijerinckii]